MYHVLKSLLSREKQDCEKIISILEAKQHLLLRHELEIVLYLLDTLTLSGHTPTIDLIIAKFPDTEMEFLVAPELQPLDAHVRLNELLRDRANKQLADEIRSMSSEAASRGMTEELAERFFQLKRETALRPSRDIEMDFLPALQRYEEKKSKPLGILTGVQQIDEVIGGVPKGIMATICGFVANGKTMWGISVAYTNTYHLKYNVVYTSLEVSRDDVVYQIYSRHSFEPQFDKFNFIPHDRIRKCLLTPEEESYLWQTVVPDFHSSVGKLVILEESDFESLSFNAIYEKYVEVDDRMIKETGTGLDAIILDHMQMFKYSMSPDLRKLEDNAKVNAFASFFRRLALDFRGRQLSILTLSQANREGWNRAQRKNGQYDLRAIAEASEIERSSTIVMSTYMDETLKASHEVRLCVLKNRFGQTIEEPITVLLDPQCNVFGESLEGFSQQVSTSDFDTIVEGLLL